MESKESDAVCRPRRAPLNWVDCLVIAATTLTFLAVVMANNPHAARAQSETSLLTESDLPVQDSPASNSRALLRAMIGLREGRR